MPVWQRLKIKTQKVPGANSNVCRSYRGKTSRRAFLIIYDTFFPSFSRSDHCLFSDSTISMPFKSSASLTCVETDVILPPFDFLHARRGVLPVHILGSSCVASSSECFDQPF